ncbi:MAG: glycosyltransferase [Prevotellaceae bacterium]|jgi:glycosyltransferase involved in cell wall biosynthesis|nr:glycosyltransferase [Prevotellaceae bacterium]
MNTKPKYTIIIPTRNSLEYLKDAIESVLSQPFSDYELIVSDNHSDDDTHEYVNSISHPNLRLIKPGKGLSMVDHWEWALTYATGEWIVFLGADDGVMPYFFELAEFLTRKAENKNIKVINSVRAYFFWDGCQNVYGDKSISYAAHAKCVVRQSKLELLDATIGLSNYLYLPQMYTASIVHISLVQTAKAKNDGAFYSSLIPDANGAAIICSIEDKYLESLIPLGWIGSSPKSNGLIFSIDKDKFKKENSLNFDSTIIQWHPLAGVFNKGVDARNVDNFKMYLFEALMQTQHLQKPFWAKIYNSRWFKTMLFATVYNQIKKKSNEVEFLKEITAINKIPFSLVLFCSFTLSRFVWAVLKSMDVIMRIKNEIFLKTIRLKLPHRHDSEIRLMDASNRIHKLEVERNFIQGFINK